MSFSREHVAQQEAPHAFASFRRGRLDTWPQSVDAIFARRMDGAEVIQSIRFDADKLSESEARAWLQDSQFSIADFEAAPAVRHDGVPQTRYDHASAAVETTAVRRFDVADLERPTKTSEGFLRAQGNLTRAGVFEYRREDGTAVRELRPPEEVFDEESMRSFSLVPLTLGHPPDNLTPETARTYQRGTVATPARAGEFVRADMLITDRDAIAAVESGRNKLSNGYTTVIQQRSGSYVDATGKESRFDQVQTRIRGNHVAICANPRAGEGAYIRTDSNEMVLREERQEGTKMDEVEVTINGVKVKVPKAVAERMDALEKEAAAAKSAAPAQTQDKEIKELLAAYEASQGRIAALEAGAAQRQDAPKSDAKATTERLIMLSRASTILEKPIDDLVRMDDAALMREVVKAAAPQVSIEGKSDDFVRGIFDMVSSQKRVDTAAALNRLVGGARDNDAATRQDDDLIKRADEAQKKMLERMSNSWNPEWREEHEPQKRAG